MKVPVVNVFIHHTAMARCYTSETCVHEIKEIQNFHMDKKGDDFDKVSHLLINHPSFK